ncbi:hypothetical protein GW915_08245 [bacterium]|nr:hypothetical protein [bacterium]
MFAWRILLNLTLSFFLTSSVWAAGVEDVLKPVHDEGFQTHLSFSVEVDGDRFEVFEAMYVENQEVVDSDLIVIAVSADSSAKLLMRDESLIGISENGILSEKAKNALLLGYAKNIMERDFGGKRKFKSEARKILKDGRAHQDLVYIFSNYLGLK